MHGENMKFILYNSPISLVYITRLILPSKQRYARFINPGGIRYEELTNFRI